jgi:hypothetical protein
MGRHASAWRRLAQPPIGADERAAKPQKRMAAKRVFAAAGLNDLS